jgi:hypothetical protein
MQIRENIGYKYFLLTKDLQEPKGEKIESFIPIIAKSREKH